jgi:hypothetical protein
MCLKRTLTRRGSPASLSGVFPSGSCRRRCTNRYRPPTPQSPRRRPCSPRPSRCPWSVTSSPVPGPWPTARLAPLAPRRHRRRWDLGCDIVSFWVGVRLRATKEKSSEGHLVINWDTTREVLGTTAGKKARRWQNNYVFGKKHSPNCDFFVLHDPSTLSTPKNIRRVCPA